MSITIEAQATRTLIQQDGVSRVAINDDGSMELLTPPSAPSGNMVTTFNQFGNSLTANGYQKLPSGLIIQWGSTTAASVTFPVAFPNGVLARILASNDWNTTIAAAGQYTAITSINNSGFTVAAAMGGGLGALRWIAIGY